MIWSQSYTRSSVSRNEWFIVSDHQFSKAQFFLLPGSNNEFRFSLSEVFKNMNKPNSFWLMNKFVKRQKQIVLHCLIWWTAHWFAICFYNFPCATLSLVYSFIIYDNLFIIYRVTRGPSRFRSSSKCSLWSSVVLKI